MSSPLLQYVEALSRVVSDGSLSPAELLAQVADLKRELVASDDWLRPEFSEPDPTFYRQYLLYGDPLERFSVVSFVWGPGQSTPIHDHTVWGVVGMLRGAEYNQPYEPGQEGMNPKGPESLLEPGGVLTLAPETGDVHRVRNAFSDRVSISIHTYGGNIGAISRSVFFPGSTQSKGFVSGYSSAVVPNLWAAR
ncbi:cysteine dioxygenase family protein [Caenimonas soli]|uniref:cysteine dioxygenase family protein n=1 Tax=Caenimonas soli TaxID=2735555 RepID=UPI001552DEC2|nr:cysteine dioxygenase [Caenimonas soli]NPC58526.1 cysteine dioxygenase [Caenimonas soli]